MRFKKRYFSYLVKDIGFRKKLRVIEWNLKQHGLYGPYPLYAKIEITQRCNLSCPKCYRTSLVKELEMNFDQFKEVIDKLGSGLCEVWTHGFGEPLLHPQYLEMMEYVRDKGMIFGVATNGSTSFFNDWNKVVELLKLKPTKVRFSVDAATPKIFEEVRYPAKYNTVMQNIRNTVGIRNFLYPKQSRNRPRVDLYCVLTIPTLNEIEPMINLRDSLGCDWVTFSDLAWNNNYGDSISENAVRQVLSREQIEELIKPYKNIPKVMFDIPIALKRSCDYTKKASYVGADGSFWYCTCVPGKEPPFGNIFEAKRINDLYNGEAGKQFRELSKTGQIPSKECERCFQWSADWSDL
jgi:radical SAM protein with 4Fe4S-binding SPASM domain